MTHRMILSLTALGGFVLCGSGFFMDARSIMSAYLAAVVTVSAAPMGALAVLLTTYIVRGAWTEDLHAPLTAAVRTLPVAGLLFLPVFFALSWLYPWAAHAEPGPLQSVYLTPWFYIARNLVYFTVLSALGRWAERAWSGHGPVIRVASIGLILYAVIASFAGIDWVESLTPSFHSSEYGLIFIAFQLLSGLSFAFAIALWSRREDMPRAYGAILLSTLLLWAYLHAMQYIVIWAGNIPSEVEWYLVRARGPWTFFLWAIAVGQFVLPFLALLSMRIRTARRPVLIIACVTLVMRYVEAIWLIVPATSAHGAILWLGFPITLVTVSSGWLLAFDGALSRASVRSMKSVSAS